MLLALLVASISDISIIQCPCSFRYTLSSSSFFRSSLNHSSPDRQQAEEAGLASPLTAHQTEHFLIFGAGAEYPPDSPQQKLFQHFLHIVALVRT